jgi:hypothetical protein
MEQQSKAGLLTENHQWWRSAQASQTVRVLHA